MICKNCGAQNNSESITCANCGSRLDTISMENTMNPVQNNIEQPVQQVTYQSQVNNIDNKKSNKGKIILISVLLGIITILIIFSILLLTGFINFGKKSIDPINNTNANNNTNTDNNSKVEEPIETKKKYEVGDAVNTVDGSNWHVIGVDKDNVTLLLDELVVEETGYGKSAAAEDQFYEKSTIKDYIDGTYMPDLISKIDAAGGDSSKIKGRIITAKEYFDLTRTKFDDGYTTTSIKAEAYDHKEEVCKILDIMSLTKSFWTASNIKDLDSSSHFYGAIYIYKESSKYSYFCNKNMEGNFAVVDLATNSNYQLNATLVGIRPVIETPSSNIK